MLKKIKDLTKEERQSICNKHKYCTDCPLAIVHQLIKQICVYLTVMDRTLEVEIEVENEKIH